MKKVLTIIAISLIAIGASAQMQDAVDVSVTVGEGSGSYLAVAPVAIDFGTVNASPTTHRYASNVLTCEFYAANAPWSVEVSADTPDTLGGLVAERDGINYSIPLKFWTANYGGAGDPNDDAEWTGAGSVFRWVLDDEEALLFKLGSSDEQAASPIPFQFAIDAEGAIKTNYSSTVTLELVIE